MTGRKDDRTYSLYHTVDNREATHLLMSVYVPLYVRFLTSASRFSQGSGKVNVSIESDTLDKSGYIKHYSADIQIPQDWRYITIPFDSLSIYPDDNPDPELPWSATAPSIKRIEFNALEGDTAVFWLDDLTVEGVDFSSVY